MNTKLNDLKMKPQQIEAEKMAVAMLNKARRLLMESDDHIEEAQKIRYEVTHELLPQHKMYILRQDSRSLLLDVDRRIQQANYRKYNSAPTMPNLQYIYIGEEGHKERKQNFLERRKERRNHRYNQVAEVVQQQNQKAVYWMVAIVVTSVFLLYGLQQVIGQNVLYDSFHWLENYR